MSTLFAPIEAAQRAEPENRWQDIRDGVMCHGNQTTRPGSPATITPAKAAELLVEWKSQAQADRDARLGSGKTVLSLFDRSGVWAMPWYAAGYDVRTLDLAEDALTGSADIMAIDREWLDDHELNMVDVVLAQPPCTHFAVSGARWWAGKDADGRTEQGVELVQQTIDIIEYLAPELWAMENPVGRLARLCEMGPPTLIFQPHHYGDPYTKRTCLWGSFNPDLPTANVFPEEGSRMHKLRGDVPEQKALRSLTPEGFAWAFYAANRNYMDPTP